MPPWPGGLLYWILVIICLLVLLSFLHIAVVPGR